MAGPSCLGAGAGPEEVTSPEDAQPPVGKIVARNTRIAPYPFLLILLPPLLDALVLVVAVERVSSSARQIRQALRADRACVPVLARIPDVQRRVQRIH